jgi:hypothetical protein
MSEQIEPELHSQNSPENLLALLPGPQRARYASVIPQRGVEAVYYTPDGSLFVLCFSLGCAGLVACVTFARRTLDSQRRKTSEWAVSGVITSPSGRAVSLSGEKVHASLCSYLVNLNWWRERRQKRDGASHVSPRLSLSDRLALYKANAPVGGRSRKVVRIHRKAPENS